MILMFCGRARFVKETSKATVRMWVTKPQLLALCQEAEITVRDLPTLDLDAVVADNADHPLASAVIDLGVSVRVVTFDDFFHSLLPAAMSLAGKPIDREDPFWVAFLLRELQPSPPPEIEISYTGTPGVRAVEI